VSRWLDDYVKAWHSYDPAAIGALFSDDATYAWHPWETGEDVARGREQIVKAWLDNQDKPGTYQAEYRPLAIDGDLVIAAGQTRYYDTSGKLERHYDNLFVTRFDDGGRCQEFTEWYMKRPS
jgi:ketosteroid isomerase-like protein